MHPLSVLLPATPVQLAVDLRGPDAESLLRRLWVDRRPTKRQGAEPVPGPARQHVDPRVAQAFYLGRRAAESRGRSLVRTGRDHQTGVLLDEPLVLCGRVARGCAELASLAPRPPHP